MEDILAQYDPNSIMENNDVAAMTVYIEEIIKTYFKMGPRIMWFSFFDEIKIAIIKDKPDIVKLLMDRLDKLMKEHPDKEFNYGGDQFYLYSICIRFDKPHMVGILEGYDFMARIDDLFNRFGFRNGMFYPVISAYDPLTELFTKMLKMSKKEKEELTSKINDDKQTYLSKIDRIDYPKHNYSFEIKSVDTLKLMVNRFPGYDLNKFLEQTKYLDKPMFEFILDQLDHKINADIIGDKIYLIGNANFRDEMVKKLGLDKIVSFEKVKNWIKSMDENIVIPSELSTDELYKLMKLCIKFKRSQLLRKLDYLYKNRYLYDYGLILPDAYISSLQDLICNINDVNSFQYMYEQHPDIITTTICNNIMYEAAYKNNLELFKLVSQYGDEEGLNTAFCEATRCDNKEIVEYIYYNSDLDMDDGFGPKLSDALKKISD